MSNPLKTLAAVFALVIFLIYVAFESIAPLQLRSYISTSIEENCISCEFTIQKLRIKLFPARVILEDVHFIMGDAKNTLVDAHVESVLLSISTRMLFKHLLKIKQVSLTNPMVIVTEGDEKTKHTSSTESTSHWDLEMDHVDLINGQFSYKREHLQKTGILQIKNINGTLGEMGSTEMRRDHPVVAHVTALLEQSGKIDLTVAPLLFSKEIYVDVSLRITDLNLAETNRFFGPEDGIKINGLIKQAQVESSVRGKKLHSQVTVDYHGLNIKFRKTSERSGLTALITNLFSGVKPVKDRGRAVTVNRIPEEPLVGFILRGMKEAALKIATD